MYSNFVHIFEDGMKLWIPLKILLPLLYLHGNICFQIAFSFLIELHGRFWWSRAECSKKIATRNSWQLFGTFGKHLFVCFVSSTVRDLPIIFQPILWIHINVTKVISKKILVKSSENYFIFVPAFYLIMCLMASPKSFEIIAILKKWQLVFYWDVKSYFGEIPLKWCIFRQRNFLWSPILPLNSSC